MGLFLFGAAFGSVAGCLFLWWIGRGQEHSDRPKSEADLVNWNYIEPPAEAGIIRLQGGGLLASFHYKGAEMQVASGNQRAKLSQLLNDFFMDYEKGYGFYFSTLREPATGYPPSDTFPGEVSRFIDARRAARYNRKEAYFQSKYYLSVVFKPNYRPEVEEFETIIGEILDKLDGQLHLKRLNGAQHIQLLYRFMHGQSQPITPPPSVQPINDLIANKEIQVIPRFEKKKHPVKAVMDIPEENVLIDGDSYVRTISITGFPGETYNGVINELNQLQCSYRWTSRIFTIDRETQEKHIKKVRKKYRIGRKGFMDILTSGGSIEDKDADVEEAYKDLNAISKMQDSSIALSEIADRSTAFAVCTSTITLMASSYEEIESRSRKVLKTLRAAGFTGTKEKFQSLNAWIGSLPGHSRNIRREYISTYNIADIIPTWSMWTGRENNPSQYMQGAPAHWQAKTNTGEPFKKHRPMDGDLGHSIIVGKSGSGKSVYVNFETLQWLRHPNSQVFLFDIGNTGELLCKAIGGNHYNILAGSGEGFQPLRGLDDQTIHNGFYYSWIEDLFRLQEVPLSTEDKKLIKQALRKVAQQEPPDRTLSQFMFQLQDRKLKDTIRLYTRDGNYGPILDSTKDSIKGGRYQVFELSGLQNMSEAIKLPILMYLFHRVERALSADRPTLIYIEEAWAAFGDKHFEKRLQDWILTLRKQNGHVALVTHSPEQIQQLTNPTLFLGNIPERVFLPEADIKEQSIQKVYSYFNLSESQMETISNLIPKKEYYLQTPAGAGSIDLQLAPVELAFIADPSGLSSANRSQKIEQLKAEYGQKWPAYWLRFIGMEKQADKLEKEFAINNEYLKRELQQ
jgi:type IV secretion system protein VirB4